MVFVVALAGAMELPTQTSRMTSAVYVAGRMNVLTATACLLALRNGTSVSNVTATMHVWTVPELPMELLFMMCVVSVAAHPSALIAKVFSMALQGETSAVIVMDLTLALTAKVFRTAPMSMTTVESAEA